MKNKIILIDQVIDLDGRWTHVVMLELTPESTILHLRQEQNEASDERNRLSPATADLLPSFPKPVLKDETTELVCHAASTGGSSFEDQVALLYTPQAKGNLVITDGRGVELLTVTI